jgi:acetylornithine deacetylase/succinyl-diaminopimelate desuccinylase-like protein
LSGAQGEAERRKVYALIDSKFESFLDDLRDYLRVPTISAERKAEEEGAEAARRFLDSRGVKTRRMKVEGGPDIVIGDAIEDPSLPTLALYNHYDVQPVDPLGEWKTDPFDPVVKDGSLHARGSADTKGNAVAQAVAMEAVREVCGALPVNLRFMIEGEEEVGSPHLPAFAGANPALFKADGATIEAGGHTPAGDPEMYMGSKGILYVEIQARTADVDQHSSLATSLPNPAWRLIEALHSIKDVRTGRILVPGFYDGIAKPTSKMISYLMRNEFDPATYKDVYGVREVYGGKTRLDRLKQYCYQPTCNIDGFLSGYVGEGSKTINPAFAKVKVDFRLLPGQRPWKIFAALKKHLKAKGFGDLDVKQHSVFEPGATPVSSRIGQACIAGIKEVYGQEASVFPWMGGSSSTYFYTSRGTPSAMPPGVGYSGSRIHAPNEHIRLQDARRAIKSFAAMMMMFPEVGASARTKRRK